MTTRDVKEVIIARADRDHAFRLALLESVHEQIGEVTGVTGSQCMALFERGVTNRSVLKGTQDI